MGRRSPESYNDQNSDSKSKLVIEICNISNRAIFCSHTHLRRTKSPFIDWYLLLQIEENVGMDTIRKKYRKFALQLHPDKNKHPKAEFAFKLVSQKYVPPAFDYGKICYLFAHKAYACLSDEAKRAAFDRERLNSFCSECSRIPNITSTPPRKTHTKVKGTFLSEKSKYNKIFERVKDIKARFKEEARIIENCLRTNATTRTESTKFDNTPETNKFRVFNTFATEKKGLPVFVPFSSEKKELPVFNPSDYLSRGYPHLREERCKAAENLQWLRTRNINYEQKGSVKRDSPVFECKPKLSPFRSKSAFVGA